MEEKRGIEIRVSSFTTGYRLKCVDKCSDRTECPAEKLQNRPKYKNREHVALSVIISNMTAAPCAMPSECWELVDSEGYSRGGFSVCERLLPPEYVNADSWTIAAGTKVHIMLVFPMRGLPSRLIFSDGDRSISTTVLPSGAALPGNRWKIRREKRHIAQKLRFQSCWSVKIGPGERRYICIGTKK